MARQVDPVAGDLTDVSVVVRMAQGDASAMADLYDSHARAVYALAFRIVGNPSDAEDVVQEAFAQAWRQAARYDTSRATVLAWLLMMTRARAIDRLRASRAMPQPAFGAELSDIPSGAQGQEAAVLSGETVSQIRAALGELGEVFRIPIELAYFEGLSQTAIAERLGIPLGTVKGRVRTALLKLRAILKAGGT